MLRLFLKNSQINIIRKIIVILANLAIIIILTIAIYCLKPGPLAQNKILAIHPDSLSAISTKLHGESIINAPKLFWFIAHLTKYFFNLKAGEYEFKAHITPFEVMQIMSRGKSVTHKLLIAEGLTNKQIIAKLNMEDVLFGKINQNIGEGHLLPDTYFFAYGDKRQTIIDQMQSKMDIILNELWESRDQNLPFKNKEEALTLASIVERETSLALERPRIAAVFINRLNRSMRLQADPTIIYAISDGLGVLDRELTKLDLQYNSPFNSYLFPGLPPYPISNPGRASLEAVFHPLQSDELYFVADIKTGGHNFASSLEEHNQNVANYRKSRLEKNIIKTQMP